MNFFSSVLEFLNSIWTWMTPGVQALASWGALLPASVGFIAALAALRTFRLRTRVDHADQWWKRVQYGLELAKSDSIADQALGSLIFGTLNSPMKPQLPEYPWSSKHQQGSSAPTLKETVGKAFDRFKAYGNSGNQFAMAGSYHDAKPPCWPPCPDSSLMRFRAKAFEPTSWDLRAFSLVPAPARRFGTASSTAYAPPGWSLELAPRHHENGGNNGHATFQAT